MISSLRNVIKFWDEGLKQTDHDLAIPKELKVAYTIKLHDFLARPVLLFVL